MNLMKNKKGWAAKDYVVGLILFSAVIALAYLMVGSLATDYGTEGIVSSSFSEHYDKLNENTESVNSMLSATSSSGGLSILGTAEILLSSTFSVINLIFGSFATLGGQVAHIGTDFGVPTAVTTIILVVFLAVVTVSIIFIIINAINRSGRL